MLEVSNLCARYAASSPDVICDITFRAERGESLCILGPNGCGKSTLLKCLSRLIEYRGTVALDSADIAAFSRKQLAKKIALLGQSVQVYFPYTVYETVSLGRYAYSQGFLQNISDEDRTIIDNTIDKLDLRGIKGWFIDELSGGQLQRVFLARTLAQTPDVILLDEPTNHLDLKNQIELLEFLKTWVRENNKTLVGVFHDINLVQRFGDSAMLLNNGRIVAHGKPEDTLNGEILHSVYGIDIRGFMLDSLEKWRRVKA